MSAVRKRNLFGFGRRKVTKRACTPKTEGTLGQAYKAAYDAGYRTSDTGTFNDWLSGAGYSEHGAPVRKRLRKEFERGFDARVTEDERAAKERAKPAPYEGHTSYKKYAKAKGGTPKSFGSGGG